MNTKIRIFHEYKHLIITPVIGVLKNSNNQAKDMKRCVYCVKNDCFRIK